MSAKVPPLQFRREDIPDLSTGERTDRLLKGLNQFGAGAEALLNGGLTFKANFRAFSKDFTIRGGKPAVAAAALDTAWHEVGAPSEPAWANSFANYGAPFTNTRFKIDTSGRVSVQIAAKDGTGSLPLGMFTLPAGRRPSGRIDCASLSNGQQALYVTPDGAVTLLAGGLGPCYAFNFSFPADDYTPAAGSDVVDQDWPIRIKNELPGAPSHVFVTRLVDVTESKETPVIASGLSWSADKDQILVHGIGNVFPGNKYRCRILVVAE